MKTATLERYHVFGTSRHNQRLTYRGDTLSHWSEGQRVFLQAPCYGHETIGAMIDAARKRGFTHIRFTGDWARYTVRKTLKIPAGGYVFKPKPIGDILREIGVNQ